MGAWGEFPLENDHGMDLKDSIFDKFGIDSLEYKGDDCAILTNNDRKIAFKSMLWDLLESAAREVNEYKTTHEAHCIAQFIIQNNLFVSSGDMENLIDILNKEDYSFWVDPKKRKMVVEQVIRDLNRI